MAILKVQSTPAVSGTGSVVLTFGSAPALGNVITVPVSAYRNGAAFGITCTDNHGNTYALDADSGDSNGARALIFKAYNIATGSPFTVTITGTGAGGTTTQIESVATEWSGFGATNPLVGAGTAIGTSCATGATASPEVAVVGVLSCFVLNFAVTSLVVGAQTPAFFEEYEQLSGSIFTLCGEADTRVDSAAGGAESISWTVSFGTAGPCCAIIALYSVPPSGFVRVTQVARETLEQDGTVGARVTQIAREILYPFTCTDVGPTPSPTGCPGQTSLQPVTGRTGCADGV